MSEVTFKQVETISEFIDAIRVRVQVFIIDQGCPPGWEPDEQDRFARHFIAIEDGAVVGTARMINDGPGSRKVERMSVLRDHRGRNIGLGLTRYLVQVAQAEGAERIWGQAQSYTTRFYQKSGFEAISEEYDLFNLGILHVTMEFRGTDQSGWAYA